MRIKLELKVCLPHKTKLQSCVVTSHFQAATRLALLLSRGAHLKHLGQAKWDSPLPTASALLVSPRSPLFSYSRRERQMPDLLFE
jgi:hypothetical protein